MFKTKKKQKKSRFSFFNFNKKSNLKNRPIPTLNESKKYFIKFIKPFLDNKSDTEFHEELINNFISDEGNLLQNKLLEFSKVIPSWYYDIMLQNFNLKNKKPIPFYSNYFIVYDLNFKDQIDAFAKIILCSIFLKRIIKDEKIKELTMKDNMQYFCLFHSCRIPHYEISNNSTLKKDKNKVNNTAQKYDDLLNESINTDKIISTSKNNSSENNEIFVTRINNQDSMNNLSPNNLKTNQSLLINSSELKSNHSTKLYSFDKRTLPIPSDNNGPNEHNLNEKVKNKIYLTKDSLKIFDYDEYKYVIVLYKNIFWLVETSLDYDHLSEQLLYITSLDLSEKKENFIGVLTGASRDKWAKARHKFLKISQKNKEFLYFIEHSMMIFCLCDSIYDRLEYQELCQNIWFNDLNNRFFDKILQIVIFKDGSVCLNVEKSAVDISVAVEYLKFMKKLNDNNEITKTVKKQILTNAGINGNLNSISTGKKNDIQDIQDTINTNFNFNVLKQNKNLIETDKSNVKTGSNDNNNVNELFKINQAFDKINYFENFNYKPVRLHYELTDIIKSEINNTSKNFRLEIESKINTEMFIFKDFGKTLFERKGVDMISFIQLAILSAHYRTYGKIVASRQFVCGRNFLFGIVEYVRTTVKESVNFIVSLNELRIPRDLKIKLGQDFFKENKKNINDVLNGKSIDVHFAGLNFIKNKNENPIPKKTEIGHSNDDSNQKKTIAGKEDEENNEDYIKEKSTIKKILNDEVFKKASDFTIETYPITNEHVKMCVQGYINEIDGLSVTYITRKDHIQFNFVSANDLKKYIQSIEEILYEMKDLFLEKGREYNSKF